jgi:hypothetical protein
VIVAYYHNQQFSLNLISWLSSQNITASKQQQLDHFIQMTPLVHFVLLWGFSTVAPLLLALVFIIRRVIWRRKYHR